MSKSTRRSRGAIVASILAVAVSVGCANQQASTPSGEQRLPHSGAPAVTKPLVTDEFEPEPCTILSKKDLDSLDVKVTGTSEDQNPPGPTCRYRRDDALSWGLAITIITADNEGLSRLYQNERIDPAGYFHEVSSVSGYPGVLTGLIDSRDAGDCDLIVGIRDDRTIQVILSGTSSKDPCGLATQIGELAIDRMKNTK